MDKQDKKPTFTYNMASPLVMSNRTIQGKLPIPGFSLYRNVPLSGRQNSNDQLYVITTIYHDILESKKLSYDKCFVEDLYISNELKKIDRDLQPLVEEEQEITKRRHSFNSKETPTLH